jgi:hypothetical protein
MDVVRRLIRPPKIAQLSIYFWRRDTERLRIVRSLFVPALDRIGEHGRLFQGKATDQRADLRCSRRVRQSLVRNRADNLMSKGRISVRLRGKSKRN